MPLFHMKIEWADQNDNGAPSESPDLFCLAETAEIARNIFISGKEQQSEEIKNVLDDEERYGPFNSKELFEAAQKAPITEIKNLQELFKFFPLDTEMHIVESMGW